MVPKIPLPYEGGNVGNNLTGSRGGCISVDKTIERYISVNKINKPAQIINIPDKNKGDGCQAMQYIYASNQNHTTVILVKITGGGHTLPGRAQYLPKLIIGNVCRDFEANEMIWQFFKECLPRE